MKERPILFSAPMVRAILAGTKTQTRRVCKPAQFYALSWVVEVPDPKERGQVYNCSHFGDEEGDVQFASPYGQPGDRLWVREAWKHIEGGGIYDAAGVLMDSHDDETIYRATRPGYPGPWRPSIHMPRRASRILLEITAVRVERLHDISEADAQAEGVERVVVGSGWRRYCDPDSEEVGVPPCGDARRSFRSLWKYINGAESWNSNPWVWVIEFKQLEGGAA
jgi:hypothetical protein